MQQIIEYLKQNNKTIATMESCTGGSLVSAITDVEGASEVLKFSAVTYSNEFKIKMGVNHKIIEKYTVYSIETAMEMSKTISDFANSNIGIGITGQLNRFDPYNKTNENNIVYISIYNKDHQEFKNFTLKVDKKNRKENKEIIINNIVTILKNIFK